jgi:probable HAF family extracellular repeat protein
MMISKNFRVQRLLAALGLGLGMSVALQAAPVYRPTLIESPREGIECSVVALNDVGQIVQACSLNRDFLRSPDGSVQRIRDPKHPNDELYFTALNNAGVVLGTRVDFPPNREAPFVWDAVNGVTTLYSPAEKRWTATSINDAGVVVGTASEKSIDGTTPQGKAFKWTQADHYQWLKPSKGRYTLATDVNAQGQVSAVTTEAGTAKASHAIRFEADGSLTRLVPGGRDSHAATINNAGHVAGFMQTPDKRSHAFFWRPETGAVDIDGRSGSRSEESGAQDMNDAGQVVGAMTLQLPDQPDGFIERTAFYWDAETGMVDLRTLLDPNDPLTAQVWRVSDWARINAHGHILVNAYTVDFKHLPLLLTPMAR